MLLVDFRQLFFSKAGQLYDHGAIKTLSQHGTSQLPLERARKTRLNVGNGRSMQRPYI